MSERGSDVGRLIQEELDKTKPSATGTERVDVPSMEHHKADLKEFVATEAAAVTKVEPEGDVPLDIEAMEKRDAEEAKKLADLGANAANKIQAAFEKKSLGSLGAVVDEYVAKAKAAGIDEAQARSVLREQLQQYHDTYKEAGLDAKAAEIDSFGRSLESANKISSEAGRAFLEMIESGAFPSEIEANNHIDTRLKGIPGTEVNLLLAKVHEHFEKERKDIKQEGIEADESDIDNALGMLGS